MTRRVRHHTETLPPDLEDALRRAFLEPPSRAAEERHLTMLASASPRGAGSGNAVVSRGRRGLGSPRLRVAVATVAVVLALPVTFAGLAAAGVRLPDPVDSAFEIVGIDLPSQSDDEEGEVDEPERDGPSQDAKTSGEDSASGSEAGAESRAGRAGGGDGDGNGRPFEAGVGNRPADRPTQAGGGGAGPNGRPDHAQDGQTGAPPQSQQGGQGVGDPPPHAQDGTGGPPPHAQGQGSQRPGSAKPITPAPKPAKPDSSSEPDG